MYEYITGKYTFMKKDYIVIENGKIGYKIFTSGNTMKNLPELNCEVKIYTSMLLRQDFIGLYGFLSRDELQMFQTLIAINGVGAKAALSILSISSPDNLKKAILKEDLEVLTKAPGIGAKTAKRIILELKEKITVITDESGDIISNESEIVMALTSLGYNDKEAKSAVSRLDKTKLLTIEASIKECLKLLMK